MKAKKIFAALLSCAMMATAMIGCNGDGSTSSTAGGDSSTSGGESTSGEKVKLKAIFCKHSLTKDVNTMQWLTDLEEKCNVEVEWQQISADWDQKKPALFASGKIPDLLFSATADSDYVQYNGLFEDLKPLIEQYAPNLQEMFKELPEAEAICTTIEGKIFGTPKYQSIWPKTNGTMYINQEWLDAVNMEMPLLGTSWKLF